jgi:hypothetical protein
MGRKKGPPYGEPDDCKYIVVDNPWGMNQAGSRRQDCVDNLGAWLNRMFDGDGTADIVYMRDRVGPSFPFKLLSVVDVLGSQTP